MIIFLILLWVSVAFGRVLYVDPSVEYDLNALCDANNIPRPSTYWKLADGLDYDTTGAGYYRNYGNLQLNTQLTDFNRPLLAEGITAQGQAGLAFVRPSSHLLHINDQNVLDMGTEDFTIMVMTRLRNRSVYQGIVSKVSGDYGFQIGYHPWPEVNFKAKDGVLTAYAYTVVLADTIIDKWWLITGIMDRTNGYLRMLMGKRSHSVALGGLQSISNNGLFKVGYADAGYSYLDADVDFVAVWKGTALTIAQAQTLSDALTPTGTLQNPFPSIQSAFYQASDGDTIIVKANVYKETLTLRYMAPEAGPDKSILVLGEGYWTRPVLDGSGLLSASGRDAIVNMNSGTTLQYFDIANYPYGRGIVDTLNRSPVRFRYIAIGNCQVGVDIDTIKAGQERRFYNLTIIGQPSGGSTKGIRLKGTGSGWVYLYNITVSGADSGVCKWSNCNTGRLGFNVFNIPNLNFTPNYNLPPRHVGFRLGFTSPLIDKGENWGVPFYRGIGPDIGAYEGTRRYLADLLSPTEKAH